MRPLRAMESMLGVWAASRGVWPFSSLSGSSAAPSGMMIAYFMLWLGARILDGRVGEQKRQGR